jgi:N-acetyl-gamma-glutamyl-phosphate reductase
MHKIPVGVLGASGYAGRELCEIVARHPRLALAFASAHERRGERTRFGGEEVTFVAANDAPLADVALLFTALPHGAAAAWVARGRAAGARVVDLSNDLRPGTGAPAGLVTSAASSGTGRSAPSAAPDDAPDLASLATRAGDEIAPYGLPELLREQIRGASVVANPGCYPTAILLALLPLLRAGLVRQDATIAISAASGVTGAGFTPRHDLLFGEVTENFRAYGVGNTHRHLAEMRAVVASIGADVDLLFTPHLLPVARGILATITVPLAEPIADPLAPFRAHYAGEPFVEIAAEPPALRDVVGRNVVRIGAVANANLRRPTLTVFSAIDNLVKGAAGQAVQNANLMLGLDETAGLRA